MKNITKNLQFVLLTIILISTVIAVGIEIKKMFLNQTVTLADLLLMFLYLEVMAMVRVFWDEQSIRITLPLLTPGLTSAALLAFMYSNILFGIHAILGMPKNIWFLTTAIYQSLSVVPAEENRAAILACILMAFGVLATFLQIRILVGSCEGALRILIDAQALLLTRLELEERSDPRYRFLKKRLFLIHFCSFQISLEKKL